MKQLVLLRHAAAESSFMQADDTARGLTQFGNVEAQDIAAQLQQQHLIFDEIVCSPAQRARQTLDVVLQTLSQPQHKLRFDDRLYQNTLEALLAVVTAIDNSVSSLLLVGHNPSLSLLARHFCPDTGDSLPTAGVCLLQLLDKTWNEMSFADGKSYSILTPSFSS